MISILLNKFSTGGCLLLLIFPLFFCNDPSKPAVNCEGPTIHGCSSSQCFYVHIFDSNGNFVNEASGVGVDWRSYFFWNGTDCHGTQVPCGKYTLKIYSVVGGSSTLLIDYILVADSTSIVKSTRSQCDSLKNNCPGSYVESATSGMTGSNVGCLCCQ